MSFSIMNFDSMSQTEKIDGWSDFINQRIEDDIDRLMNQYVEEYSKQIDISDLSSIDMFVTYYDTLVYKYCNPE